MKQFDATEVARAAARLSKIVRSDNLEYSPRLSKKYHAKIYLKREDLQIVRSYKLRGAYNLMSQLSTDQLAKGVVTASAGNHAQGVAYAAARLKIRATIYMPLTTPNQKVERVAHFGGRFVTIELAGKNFDEACRLANRYCDDSGATFVHPFDDLRVIYGQATIGKEILDELGEALDAVVCPIGGGGVAAGVVQYLRDELPQAKVYGVEPAGASSLQASLRAGRPTKLINIDTFVDGAAVKEIGHNTFHLLKGHLSRLVTVPEGKICSTMIDLYQNEGIIAEPAGALAVSGLDSLVEQIRGKTVVCIISGGNNDLLRYPEILERSLVYEGKKHYFMIEFAQKPGQLRAFLNHALGPHDDIVRFEYMKKSSREQGAALVGIELQKASDYDRLLTRIDDLGISYSKLEPTDMLYDFVV